MGLFSKLLGEDDPASMGITEADLGPADSRGRLRNANTVAQEKRAQQEAKREQERQRNAAAFGMRK